MTTDNRTSEPSDEQIVRGVRKLLNRYSLRGDVPCDEIDKLIDDSEAGLLSEGAPSEAQARAIRKLDNVQAILAGAQASVTDAVRELSLTSAALVAAGVARPVNGFDTTAERVKNGADSVHVAPQEPNQTETKSGNNFVSLDPEKVAEVLLANAKSRYGGLLFEERAAARIAHALCEAYTEERLTK